MEQEIKFGNIEKGLCVICERHIETPVVWICGRCLKPCEVDTSRILENKGDKMLIDAKSRCCNADIRSIGRVTCSEKCHDRFVKKLEMEFGEVKQVIDSTTGIAYKVPTRDIIERGLIWQDLPKYPQWN